MANTVVKIYFIVRSDLIFLNIGSAAYNFASHFVRIEALLKEFLVVV